MIALSCTLCAIQCSDLASKTRFQFDFETIVNSCHPIAIKVRENRNLCLTPAIAKQTISPHPAAPSQRETQVSQLPQRTRIIRWRLYGRNKVSVSQETHQGSRTLVDRAVRHELRIPLRYRREGHHDWFQGETINMSESGILFSSNEMLEVDSRLEITFQTSGSPLLQSSTRQAMVVRRTLANWPDTRLIFGARFRP
jgi:hypothetical protein